MAAREKETGMINQLQETKRIRLLDVLRGFAIIGTLGTNIWLFTQPGDSISMFIDGGGRSLIELLQSIFINGKFLGLLTIMFGIGLELKYRKASRDRLPWLPLYIWTMAILFIDGLLHYLLVFDYDILMSYAITGIIVAFIIKCREKIMTRWMRITATIHVIGVLFYSASTIFVLQDPAFQSFMDRLAVGTSDIYINGTYVEQIQYRIEAFFSLRMEAIAIIFMNIFLYLLGIRLMRAGAFASDENGRRIRRKLLYWGIGVGLPLNLLALVPGGYFEIPIRYLFAPILSLGYIGVIAWLMESGILRWFMARFEAIGKTALSCYVLQNIVASVLFYSWGFRLAPITSPFGTLFAWAGITVLMMVISHLFVKYWGTGPLEWMWRTLSYRPFRKN